MARTFGSVVDSGKIGQINSLISSSTQVARNVFKIDPRFLDPTDFKKNDMGFFVNNWVRLSNQNNSRKSLRDKTLLTVRETFTDAEVKNVDTKRYLDVLLFNVFVNISQAPNIVKNDVKGLDGGTIKQLFNTGDFNITISGTLSSPVSWQSDNISIQNLKDLVADQTEALYIQNPEINKLYDVRKVVITNYSIKNNTKFLNLRDFSISFLSDDAKDIFRTTKDIRKNKAK